MSQEKTDTVIRFEYYTVSFNNITQQSNYVSYRLTPNMLESKYKRNDKFHNSIKNIKTLTNENFKGSGYDRGHLVPASNMSFDSIALIESFEYVNITYQTPSLNRGIWKSLETKLNMYCKNYDTLHIITGPIFENKNNIPVSFFKVVLIKNKDFYKGIGFIIPNLKEKKSFKELSIYAKSIDDIEELTKYNFFGWVKDDIERDIENEIDYLFWFYK